MALHVNFFNDGKTVYNAEDFVRPWNALLTPGVFGSADFTVSASSPAALTVEVAPGNAVNGGYFVSADATTTLEISANTSGYNRYDLAIIDVDTNSMSVFLRILEGVPSSSPVPPAAQANQIPLAQILVGNNVSVVDANVITDRRQSTAVYHSPTAGLQGESGWWKDPNTGFIIQWGVLNNVYASGAFMSFPLVFPTLCSSIQLTTMTSGAPGMGLIGDQKQRDGFVAGSTQNGTNLYYRAIGY